MIHSPSVHPPKRVKSHGDSNDTLLTMDTSTTDAPSSRSSRAPVRLAASTLGKLFAFDCDKAVRLECLPSDEKARYKISGTSTGSAVMSALSERGNSFEAGLLEVLRSCEKDGPLILHQFDSAAGNNGMTATDATLAFFRDHGKQKSDTGKGVALFQAALQVTETIIANTPWLQKLREQHSVVPALCLPDFILIDMNEEKAHYDIVIVDAKSSARERITHQVQVAMYQIVLELILSHHHINEARLAAGLPGFHVSDNIGIWIPTSQTALRFSSFILPNGPTIFDNKVIRDKLQRDFFDRELPAILSQPVSSIFWHLTSQCAGCSFFEYCKKKACGGIDDVGADNDSPSTISPASSGAHGPGAVDVPMVNSTSRDRRLSSVRGVGRGTVLLAHSIIRKSRSFHTSAADVTIGDIEDFCCANDDDDDHDDDDDDDDDDVCGNEGATAGDMRDLIRRQLETVIGVYPQGNATISALTDRMAGLSQDAGIPLEYEKAEEEGKVDDGAKSALMKAVHNHVPTLKPGVRTPLFPYNEDYAVVITVQVDPSEVSVVDTIRLYSWGILINKKDDCPLVEGLPAVNTPLIHSVSTAGQDDKPASMPPHVQLHHTLVTTLYNVIQTLANDPDFVHKHSVGFYFHSRFEHSLLEKVLLQSALLDSHPDPHFISHAMEVSLMLCQGSAALALPSAPDLGLVDVESEMARALHPIKKHADKDKTEYVAQLYQDIPSAFLDRVVGTLQNRRVSTDVSSRTGELLKKGKQKAIEMDLKRRYVEKHCTQAAPEEVSVAWVDQQWSAMESRYKAQLRERQQNFLRPRLGFIEDTIHSLFFLPVPGNPSYRQLYLLFNPDHQDKDWVPFLHELDIDQLYAAWRQGGASRLHPLLSTRLYCELSLLRRMRQLSWETNERGKMETRLMYPAATFAKVAVHPFRHALYSRLAYITQHESLQACDDLRLARITQSVPSLLLSGQALCVVGQGVEPMYPNGYQPGDRNKNGSVKKEPKGRLCTFRLHPDSSHMRVIPDRSDFKQWLCVPFTAEGIAYAQRFDDMSARHDTYRSQTCDITAVTDDGDILVYLPTNMWSGIHPSSDFPGVLEKGKRYLLFKRYMDMYLIEKVQAELKRLDTEDDPLFMRLVNNSHSWDDDNAITPEQDVFLSYQGPNPVEEGLKDSQKAAYDSCLRHHLQCIWGPPGSGKTFFIARLILAFAHRYIHYQNPSSEDDSPFNQLGGGDGVFKISVTSSTNSAIATCLDAIAEGLETSFPELKPYITIIPVGPTVAELTQVQSSCYQPRVRDEKGIKPDCFNTGFGSQEQRRVVILGATPWRLCKIGYIDDSGQHIQDSQGKTICPFDLTVIDEGSQMTVGVAAIPLRFVNPCGRVVVLGDHLQLPPIIRAGYPQPRPGQPKLFGSILECLLRAPDSHIINPFQKLDLTQFREQKIASKLKENFRMNEAIGKFAQYLYGDEYTSQNPDMQLILSTPTTTTTGTIGTTTTTTTTTTRGTQVVSTGTLQQLFSAHESLVTVYLPVDQHESGFMTAQAAADREAAAVCDIVSYFLTGYDQAQYGNKPAWANVLIVTPHHVQRRAVRSALSSSGQVSSEHLSSMFIDTAEKAQGRTAQLVLLCYGVLSAAQVAQDAEFLLTPNRLNVATTRARCKSILITGQSLVQARIPSLSTEATQRGYRLLLEFMEQSREYHLPSTSA